MLACGLVQILPPLWLTILLFSAIAGSTVDVGTTIAWLVKEEGEVEAFRNVTPGALSG